MDPRPRGKQQHPLAELRHPRADLQAVRVASDVRGAALIVVGFWGLLLGLFLCVGGRLQLPRGETAYVEAKRKAIRQSAWVLSQ
jgi:hypothetical protein